MDIPPWHIGHVIKKVMQSRDPEVTRGKLAEDADVDPMTITNMLRGGNYERETLEAICRALEISPAEVQIDLDRSNAGRAGATILQHPTTEARRRAADREQQVIDAEQYARRIIRLPVSARISIYAAISAFEEAISAFRQRREQ